MVWIVSLNEASKIFGYDRKTIQLWIDNEGAPVVSRRTQGKATLVDTVALSEWVMARESGATPMERARLGKLQEEVIQLTLLREDRQAQLCPTEHARELFEGTMTMMRTGLDSLPGQLAGKNKALHKVWAREIAATLGVAQAGFDSFLKSLKRPDDTQ